MLIQKKAYSMCYWLVPKLGLLVPEPGSLMLEQESIEQLSRAIASVEDISKSISLMAFKFRYIVTMARISGI